jgi:hypothetical protein
MGILCIRTFGVVAVVDGRSFPRVWLSRAAHVDARDQTLRNHHARIAVFVIVVCIPRA